MVGHAGDALQRGGEEPSSRTLARRLPESAAEEEEEEEEAGGRRRRLQRARSRTREQCKDGFSEQLVGGARPPWGERDWLSAGSGRLLIGPLPNNGQVSLKRQCLSPARAAQSPAALSFRVSDVSGLGGAGPGPVRARRPPPPPPPPAARPRGCFAQAPDADEQSAAKPPAQRPSSPSLATARKEGEGREGGRALGGACPGRCPARFPRPRPARTFDQESSRCKWARVHGGHAGSRTPRPVLLSRRLGGADPRRPPPVAPSRATLMRGPRAKHTLGDSCAQGLGGGASSCPRAGPSVGPAGPASAGSSLPSRQPVAAFQGRARPSGLQWACEHRAAEGSSPLGPLGLVLAGLLQT
ncbi:translation initiation factor IF-2-like [Peromyscus californicus insignis]|uniref:translation initiation factor IF-2-like n=1 Tax=Peromyscus californicus insignis TaxID=564181 RepID=UPI0022A6EEAE|nr:translation initiation factor IF-2-like [Peromyscus californicus insignis]